MTPRSDDSSSSRRRRRQAGAILPDGSLNVDLLSKEIVRDVSADAKYKAEDDMKKRAIHSSKDYDEFKSFVACSQLRPLDRRDVAELFDPSSLASAARTKKATRKKKTTIPSSSRCSSDPLDGSSGNGRKGRRGGKKKGKDDAAPRTGMEFDREWRRRCPTPSEGALFLTSPASSPDLERESNGGTKGEGGGKATMSRPPPPEEEVEEGGRNFRLDPRELSRTAFKAEVDAIALGRIVESLAVVVARRRTEEEEGTEVLEEGISSNLRLGFAAMNDDDEDDDEERRARFVATWLGALTNCGRFDLNLSFLSDGQRKCLRSTFEFLEGRRGRSNGGNQVAPLGANEATGVGGSADNGGGKDEMSKTKKEDTETCADNNVARLKTLYHL